MKEENMYTSRGFQRTKWRPNEAPVEGAVGQIPNRMDQTWKRELYHLQMLESAMLKCKNTCTFLSSWTLVTCLFDILKNQPKWDGSINKITKPKFEKITWDSLTELIGHGYQNKSVKSKLVMKDDWHFL